jgi:hypothetical protein
MQDGFLHPQTAIKGAAQKRRRRCRIDAGSGQAGQEIEEGRVIRRC